MQLQQELQTAKELARQAGQLAMGYYGQSSLHIRYKGDSRQSPVTQADLAANALIVQGLSRQFPEDGLWAEESLEQDEQRARHQKRLWCIDPIDGTQEFIHQNGEFAVMIGLALDGQATLGVIYQPTEDRLFWAIPGSCGMEERGQTLPLQLSSRRIGTQAEGQTPILAVSRSHAMAGLEKILTPVGPFRTHPSGSVGLKLCLLAQGKVDMYLSSAQYMAAWDTCAPEAIVRCVGGIVSNSQGFPLSYQEPTQTTGKGIVAATPALWPYCLQALAQRHQSKKTGL